jgi:hypothetical protein
MGEWKMRPVVSRRLAIQFPKNAIEMGQGLETDIKGDFADACMGFEQLFLGFFNAHPAQVVGEA